MGCACAHRPKGPERVDFLYEAPTTDKQEYLLGKPIDIKPEESEVKKVTCVPFMSSAPHTPS